jgi:hypothetical protein
MSKRDYSEDEKAEILAVLDANEGNRKRTARQLKVPRTTIITWENKPMSENLDSLRHQKKRELADKIDEVVWQIVTAMPEKIEKAGLKDSAIAMGTGIDKSNLLRGDPTSITGSADSLQSAQQIFAKKYRELNPCSPEEAQKQSEIAFQFAKVEDHTENPAS